jgi:ferrous iron transport protein B
MDKLMARCGLSGKSFIPMLSSVACAVPGIMATRVIENRRDRLATILVAPLMSCSARLPVYTLLIGAFFGDNAWLSGLVLFAMYMIGFIVAPLMAMLFKRTLLRGAAPAYIMELPLYKRPSIVAVLRRMITAGGSFLKRAGTYILAAMILVWAATYYPNERDDQHYDIQLDLAEKAGDEDAARQIHSEWQRQSYLGQAGLSLEPFFGPLGWDWRLGMAALASFPAREVAVGTLGIIYNIGSVDDDQQRDELRSAMRDDWSRDPIRGKYGVPVALSFMVFFALCCQCVSTLAVIRRETGSWAWPAVTFVYMTGLAYGAALIVFQMSRIIVDALT